MSRRHGEAARDKACECRCPKESYRLAAAEVLRHAHQVVDSFVLHGVGEFADTAGKVAGITGNTGLITLRKLVGDLGDSGSDAAKLAGCHVLLLAGKTLRLFGRGAKLALRF